MDAGYGGRSAATNEAGAHQHLPFVLMACGAVGPILTNLKHAPPGPFHIDEECSFMKYALFTFNVRFCMPFLLSK